MLYDVSRETELDWCIKPPRVTVLKRRYHIVLNDPGCQKKKHLRRLVKVLTTHNYGWWHLI